MGEFLKVGNQRVKVGTCENLYYATFAQLLEQRLLGNKDVEQYLEEKHGFRYRFPFPDEGGIKIGQYEHHNRAYPITIPKQDKNDKKLYEIDAFHEQNCCMKSKKYLPLGIRYQKLVDGKLHLIVECRKCKCLTRYDQEGIQEVLKFLEARIEELRVLLKGFVEAQTLCSEEYKMFVDYKFIVAELKLMLKYDFKKERR